MLLASGGALHKKYDSYLAIEDESVAGLNLDAPVKFNGVAVGSVQGIQLDPVNPERVRLTFAIERGTPIKEDTLAVLNTQGLTGIAYVELSGGAPNAAPLRATALEPYPVIRTKPSLSARLENILTAVLPKLERTSSNIDAVLSTENRAAFTSTLADLAVVTHTIAMRKNTIDAGITNMARTFDNTARITARLGPVIEHIDRAAQSVDKMGGQTADASVSVGRTFDLLHADVQQFNSETSPELQRLLIELNALSTSLRTLSEDTERNPAGFLIGPSPVPEGPGESSTAPRPP